MTDLPFKPTDKVLHAWAQGKGYRALVLDEEARTERVLAFFDDDAFRALRRSDAAADVLTLRDLSKAAHEAMTSAVKSMAREVTRPKPLHPYGRRTAQLLHELSVREGWSPAGRAARALLRGEDPTT